MYKFKVSTVPANVLAPFAWFSAKISAATVVTGDPGQVMCMHSTSS